jgi:pimeloyl-ACP methyl ester carboxylesterase
MKKLGLPEKQPKNGEVVVLLHGALRRGSSMKLLSKYLEHQGYETLSISYPSNQQTFEELAVYLDEQLKVSDQFNKATKVHFVTHSMGGIVTRYFLGKNAPAHLGRVVMMGPPNQGSEFADFMSEQQRLKPYFDKIFGPSGAQMKTEHDHSAAGKITYDVGVIAGCISINPLAPWVLDGAHDGIVPVERTKLDGMRDHIVVRATHTMMMYNPKVWQQVGSFLKNGAFDHKPNPNPAP